MGHISFRVRFQKRLFYRNYFSLGWKLNPIQSQWFHPLPLLCVLLIAPKRMLGSILWPKKFFDQNFFFTKKFFWQKKIFLTKICFDQNLFLTKTFLTNFFHQKFSGQKFLTKIFSWPKRLFDQKNFLTKFFLPTFFVLFSNTKLFWSIVFDFWTIIQFLPKKLNSPADFNCHYSYYMARSEITGILSLAELWALLSSELGRAQPQLLSFSIMP